MNYFTKLKVICLAAIMFSFISVHAQLTVQSGVELKTSNNAVITLQDINLFNNGIINQQAGEGRFVFSGTAGNFIYGSINPLFNIVEIAKTGSAKVLLSQNINIGSGISFTSGLIDLNGYNVLLQSTAVLSNETESSHIISNGGGYIEITKLLNAPVAVNPGSLGATITSLQNMGSTVIRRGQTSQTNASGGGSSILRYYDIIPANNSSLNATLRFSYLDAELNGLNENMLDVWKSVNHTTWTNIGSDSRDGTNNYVQKTGIADFARFTLSTTQNALPIRFGAVTINCINGNAAINWKTEQEENSSYFEIQKSTDGLQWNAVGSVIAAGNSYVEKSYSFTDVNPANEKRLYRVAEYDISGAVNYSGIAASDCGINNDHILIYPNPAKDVLYVSVNNAFVSSLKMELTDSKGIVMRTKIQSVVPGNNKFGINVQGLSNGLYIITVYSSNGDKIKTVKVVKE